MIRRFTIAAIILTVALIGLAFGLLLVTAIGTQCHYAQKQYDTSHRVIIEQNKIQPASPIILKAFPQFVPFYTPGTPQYAEAARIAKVKQDAAFAAQGPRPSC
jgi:hypothetical protein